MPYLSSVWVPGTHCPLNNLFKGVNGNEGNTEENLGSDFLGPTLKAWFMKEIIDKLDFIKIKNCVAKDTIKRVRRQDTDCEKYIWKDISDKVFLPKIFKNS